MSRVFVTGSADGLGQMAARLLASEGHDVVLHARDLERGKQAIEAVPGAETVVTADLSSIAETKILASEINRLGAFDAIIHNAGVGYMEPRPITTADSLPHVFAVNSLAPYILTCLIEKPGRLKNAPAYLGLISHVDFDYCMLDSRFPSGSPYISE